MIDDTDEGQKTEAYQRALLAEERHYAQLKRVFGGSSEGVDVLEWLLTDLCGYWRGSLDNERQIGRFELGRTLLNQICMADIEIVHTLLDRRRKMAQEAKNEERRRLEKVVKE